MASRFFVILAIARFAGSVSGAESPANDNAALLYYRATWAPPLPLDQADELRNGHISTNVENYFSYGTTRDAIALIRAAGRRKTCNWGIDEGDDGTLAWISVVSRIGHDLSDLPLNSFLYQCAAGTNRVPATDLLAALNLAAHVQAEHHLDLGRQAVLAKTCKVAAARIDRIDGQGLNEIQNFIRHHEDVLTFRVGDALRHHIKVMRGRIAQFRSQNPGLEKGNLLDEFLGEHLFSPTHPVVAQQKTSAQVFELAEREFKLLESVADVFNLSKRDEFERAVQAIAPKYGAEHPGRAWIENYKKVWERFYATSQHIYLFKLGLARVIAERSAITPDALPAQVELEPKSGGFVLRVRGERALGRPVELAFGAPASN